MLSPTLSHFLLDVIQSQLQGVFVSLSGVSSSALRQRFTDLNAQPHDDATISRKLKQMNEISAELLRRVNNKKLPASKRAEAKKAHSCLDVSLGFLQMQETVKRCDRLQEDLRNAVNDLANQLGGIQKVPVEYIDPLFPAEIRPRTSDVRALTARRRARKN